MLPLGLRAIPYGQENWPLADPLDPKQWMKLPTWSKTDTRWLPSPTKMKPFSSVARLYGLYYWPLLDPCVPNLPT